MTLMTLLTHIPVYARARNAYIQVKRHKRHGRQEKVLAKANSFNKIAVFSGRWSGICGRGEEGSEGHFKRRKHNDERIC